VIGGQKLIGGAGLKPLPRGLVNHGRTHAAPENADEDVGVSSLRHVAVHNPLWGLPRDPWDDVLIGQRLEDILLLHRFPTIELLDYLEGDLPFVCNVAWGGDEDVKEGCCDHLLLLT
jgi:hypothetical protein